MVAINFQPRFAPLVSIGAKRQTIRTKARCEVGDRLQLYTGQRTKDCVKLVTPDPICTFVGDVTIAPDGLYIPSVMKFMPDVFARADGFNDYAEMYAWFHQRYDCLEFIGKLIKWEPYE